MLNYDSMDPNQIQTPQNQPQQTQPIAQPDPGMQQAEMQTQAQPVSQPTPQAQAQPQPIYSGYCYYAPPGTNTTLFAFKNSMFVIYPGWLIMQNEMGMEIARIMLSPDIVATTSMGQCRIKFMGGQKTKLREPGKTFIFYNPMMMFLSYWFAWAKGKDAKQFAEALKVAAGAPTM